MVGLRTAFVLIAIAASLLSSPTALAEDPPQLPFGEGGTGRFGAYYTSLPYTPDWERQFPAADFADVVVRFEGLDHRLIFWRGASYVPCWAVESGPWYTNGFFERRGGHSSGTVSMVEPISDKQVRYSRVRVLESSPARTVIHWRYAPVDLDYGIPFVDRETRWGDWADEYYTVYPDGLTVRRATLWTSAPDEWIEYQESIVVNPPGTLPGENIEAGAVTLANLQGESHRYHWTGEGGPSFDQNPDETCIQLVHLKSGHRPFVIVPSEEVELESYQGHAPGLRFNFWGHWPVSQEKSDTRVARSDSRPSHSSLSHLKWPPYRSDGRSISWIMLSGVTRGGVADLLPLARAWNRPPSLRLVEAPEAELVGYDPGECAYRLIWKPTGVPGPLRCRLEGSAESPVASPAFRISGWDPSRAVVFVDGKQLQEGSDYRQGHVSRDGVGELILWIDLQLSRPVSLEIRPEAP